MEDKRSQQSRGTAKSRISVRQSQSIKQLYVIFNQDKQATGNPESDALEL